jgi:hypothetical protein
MRLFVVGCGVVLALAIAYVLLASGPDALLASLRSQSIIQQLAWIVMIIATVAALAAAFWSNEQLSRQRNALQILESRLRVEEAQKDVDRATSQLGRTVSDSSLREMQQRLAKAEKDLGEHLRLSDGGEFQTAIAEIRTRQDALKEKLGEAVTKRRSIEQLFADYEGAQRDIERILAGVEQDQKGDSLDARIGNLSQFTKVTESRFHDLEQSKQVLVQLGEEYAALQARLLPLKDERSGIKAMIHQLDDSCAPGRQYRGAGAGRGHQAGGAGEADQREPAPAVGARVEPRRGAVQAGQQPQGHQFAVRQAESRAQEP